MPKTESITIQKTSKSKLQTVDFNNLDFGKYISDHMAMASYTNKHWQPLEIVPYGDLAMSPAMLSLHYGQSIFEGMKAFKMKDGNANIFRLKKHHQRLNKSLARMCMPEISEPMFTEALESLIEVDQNWIPTIEGASLYIRPVVFATEARLGVKISDQYKFIIMTTPVGPYFSKPYRLKVEDHYVRTAEGGTGFAKCSGNYGGAFYPTQVAREEGFDQLLWTDHKDHNYIDEVGMMNVMFVINETLVTPKLNTAILDGVTRDTIITLAKEMNIPVEERRIAVSELESAFKNNTLSEAFGVGTAAVVVPIQTINIRGVDYSIDLPAEESIQFRIKNKLLQIRTGEVTDTHSWNHIVPLN
ncbi:MAG TPA: branched-chain amino acid aminotransferase [Cyclobacteriaceae bacterium]